MKLDSSIRYIWESPYVTSGLKYVFLFQAHGVDKRNNTALVLYSERLTMNSLSTRSCFLIFCIIIAVLTLAVLESPVLQTDRVSASSPKDINININVLQNYSCGKVRTETKDGKLDVIFEVKAVLDLGPYSIDSDIGEIEKVLNHSIVLRTTQEEKNKTVETEDQTSKINSTRNNVSELVKKFPLTISESPYIIYNKDICNSEREILFLVLVHTATEHFKRRQSLRKTWGNITLYQTYQMRIVFLLGIPKNRSLNAKIKEENSQHGDIVQGNFIDDYVNLTHKGVMGLRWVTENCRQAKFIVKVDDDVFVNTLLLIENLLGKFWYSSRHIMGDVLHSALIFRWGKWDAGKDQFVNMTNYPFPYCTGVFVILTNDIVEELYKAAKATDFFWIDDVYLFGILPDKVGNISLSPLAGLAKYEQTAIDCFAATEKKCDLLAANANDYEVMEKMWGWALWQNTKLAMEYLTYNR